MHAQQTLRKPHLRGAESTRKLAHCSWGDCTMPPSSPLPTRCLATMLQTVDIVSNQARTPWWVQDKTLRTMVLSCLCQCTNSYLQRFAASQHRERLYSWVSRTAKPVLQSLRKGQFLMNDQQVRESKWGSSAKKAR